MANTTTVNVNGKDFILYPPSIAYNGNIYYTYFSTRNGERFGPIRTAVEGKGGLKSVGRQLADAGRVHFGDAMIAAERAKKVASVNRRIAELDRNSRWYDSELEHLQKELVNIEANG